MSNFYNLTSAYQNTVAKISTNDSYSDDYGDTSSKATSDYYSQEHINRVMATADASGQPVTGTASPKGSTTSPFDPKQPPLHIPTPGDNALDTLLAAFKNDHDILSEVILIMMLMSEDTGDSAQRQADDLTNLVQDSKNLKLAADAIDALNTYLKSQLAKQPPGSLIVDETVLDDPANGLAAFKTGITSLGHWTEGGSVSIEDAFTAMNAAALTGVTDVDNTTDLTTITKDGQDLVDAISNSSSTIKDPTSEAADMFNQLTISANAATNVNQTKSAQLQGLTNNYQMQLSMVTSFLQRVQDLNSKITSLT